MFNNFNEDARKVMVIAKEEMYNLKHPYVSSEHLLLAILKGKNNVSDRLKKYKLDYNIFRQEIIKTIGFGSKQSEWTLYTPVLKSILERAIMMAKDANSDVTIELLFASLIEENEGIAIRIMINLDIDLDVLYHDFVAHIPKNKKKKRLLLDEVGRNLTKQAQIIPFDPVVGRNVEIKRMMEILSRRNKNNPLLIGDAGVGKTAIVEELCRMIVNNEVPNSLRGKQIYALDLSSVVAGTKYRGEFEDKLNRIIKEVEDNSNIILFIDEIHTIVGAGGAEGAIDAANIFKPALARGSIRCIGATTTSEYKKFMESDKALERRFQTILIEEPDITTVQDIINTLRPIYEDYHKVVIPDSILTLLINLSNKYIKNRRNPDKTIDLLDEVCSHANLKENKKLKLYNDMNKKLYDILKRKKECILKNNFDEATKYRTLENEMMNKINNLELELSNSKLNIVTKKDLEEVLELRVKTPIYELGKKLSNNSKMINHLEKKIIGQNEAIETLIDVYSNNLIENNCYGVLFYGPSGVGKTELAKTFAKEVGGNVIRIDMSEYSEEHSVSKFIGSPPGYVGYNDVNNVFEEIKTRPFTILILDEIEKAHRKVMDLFFQILDNNSIKDSKGDIIHFNNVIIIMTSNIGYKDNKVGFYSSNKKHEELNKYFGLPFMNRIHKVISFNKLTVTDIEKIIWQLAKKMKRKVVKHDINNILSESNYEEYGARQISYLIKEYPKIELVKSK